MNIAVRVVRLAAAVVAGLLGITPLLAPINPNSTLDVGVFDMLLGVALLAAAWSLWPFKGKHRAVAAGQPSAGKERGSGTS